MIFKNYFSFYVPIILSYSALSSQNTLYKAVDSKVRGTNGKVPLVTGVF